LLSHCRPCQDHTIITVIIIIIIIIIIIHFTPSYSHHSPLQRPQSLLRRCRGHMTALIPTRPQVGQFLRGLPGNKGMEGAWCVKCGGGGGAGVGKGTG